MALLVKTYFLVLILLGSISGESASIGVENCGFLRSGHPLFETAENFFAVGLVQRPLFMAQVDGKWFCPMCSDSEALSGKIRKTKDRKNKALLALNLELREDVKWGDGRQVDGNDVAFTVKTVLSLLASGEYVELEAQGFWKKIDHVYVDPKNPRKFAIFFFALESDVYQFPNFYLLPSALFTELLGGGVGPKDLLRVKLAYDSQVWGKEASLGLFNGPYLPSQSSRTEVVLKKSPDQDLKTNNIQTITIRRQWLGRKERTEAVLKCSGYSRHPRAEGLGGSQISFSVKSSVFEVLVANQRNPALANPELRIPVLEYASGQATPDPELLERKLRGLGWKKNLAKKFSSMGKELDLSLVITDIPSRLAEAKRIQDRLRLSGVDLNIQVLSTETFQKQVIERPNFPSLAMLAWPMAAGDYLRSFYHSKETPTFENDYRGQNYMGWHFPEIDRLYDQILAEFDPEEISRLLGNRDALVLKERPMIVLYEYLETFDVPKGFTGFAGRHPLFPASLSADSWSLHLHGAKFPPPSP